MPDNPFRLSDAPGAFSNDDANSPDLPQAAGFALSQAPGSVATYGPDAPLTPESAEYNFRNDPFYEVSPEAAKLLFERWKNGDQLQRYVGIPASAFANMLPELGKQVSGAWSELKTLPDGGWKKLPATFAEAGRQLGYGTYDLARRGFAAGADKLMDVAGVGGPQGELERFRDRLNLQQELRRGNEGYVDGYDADPNTAGVQPLSKADNVLPNVASVGSMLLPFPGGPVAGAAGKVAGVAGRTVGKAALGGAVRAGMMDAYTAAKLADDASRLAAATSTKLASTQNAVSKTFNELPGKVVASTVEKLGVVPKAGAGALEQLAYAAQQPFVAFNRAVEKLPPGVRAAGLVPQIGTGVTQGMLLLSESALEAVRRYKALPVSQSGKLRQLAAAPGSPQWLKSAAGFLDNAKVGAAAQFAGDLTQNFAKSAVGGYLTGVAISDDPETAGQFAAMNLGQTALINGVRKLSGSAAASRREAGIRGDLAAFLVKLEESGARPELIQRLRDNEAAVLAALNNPHQKVDSDGTRAIDTLEGAAGLAATYMANLNNRVRIEFLTPEKFAQEHPNNPNAAGSHENNVVKVNLGSSGTPGGTLMHELAHNLAAVMGKDGSMRVAIDTLLGQEKVKEVRDAYIRLVLQNNGVPEPSAKQIFDWGVEKDRQNGGDSWVYGEIYAEAAKKAFGSDLMRQVFGKTNVSVWRRLKNAVAGHFSEAAKDAGLPADALFAISEVYSPEMRRLLTQDLRDLYKDGPGNPKPAEDVAIPVGVDQIRTGTPAVAKDADGLRVNSNNQLVYDERAAKKAQVQRAAAVRRAVANTNPAPANDTTPDVKPRPGLDGRTEVAQGIRVSPLMESTGLFSDTSLNIVRGIEQSLANGSGTVFRLWYNPIGTSSRGVSWAKDVARRKGNIPATLVDAAFYDFHVSSKGHVLARGLSLTAMERRLAEWSADPKSQLNSLWNGDTASFRRDLDTYLSNHANGVPGESNGIGVSKKNALNFFIIGRLARLADLNPLRDTSAKSLIRSLRVDRMASMSAVADKSMPLNYPKLAENFSPDVTQYSPAPRQVPGQLDGYDLSKSEFEKQVLGGKGVKAPLQQGATPKGFGWFPHRDRVKAALEAGLDVPTKAVAEYTDLAWLKSQRDRAAGVVPTPKAATGAQLDLGIPQTAAKKPKRADGLPEPKDTPDNVLYNRAPQAEREAALAQRDKDRFTGLTSWYSKKNTSPDRVQSLVDVVPKSAIYRDLLVHLMYDPSRQSGPVDPAAIRETWKFVARTDAPRVYGVASEKANRQAVDLLTLPDNEVAAKLAIMKASPEVINAVAAARDVLPVIPKTSPLGQYLSGSASAANVGITKVRRASEGPVLWVKSEPDFVYKVIDNTLSLVDVEANRGDMLISATTGSSTHGALTKTDRQTRMPGGLPADIVGLTEDGHVVIKMPRLERHATFNEVDSWKQIVGSSDGIRTRPGAGHTLIRAAAVDQPVVFDKRGNAYATSDLRYINQGGGHESPNMMVDSAGRVYALDLMFMPIDEAVLKANPSFKYDLPVADADNMLYSPDPMRKKPSKDGNPLQPKAPSPNIETEIYERAWQDWDMEKLQKVVENNQEGFTVSKDGTMPKGAYVVAPWKKTEWKINKDELNDRTLTEYFEAHRDEFRTRGAHFGGWLHTYTNEKGVQVSEYVLDVVFPVEKLEDAVKLAIWGDQNAIFNLNEYKTIDTKTRDAAGNYTAEPLIPDGVNLTLEQIQAERRTVGDVRAFASRAVGESDRVRQPRAGSAEESALAKAAATGTDSSPPGQQPGQDPAQLSGPPTRTATPDELVTTGDLQSSPAAEVDGHWIMSPSVPEPTQTMKKKNQPPPPRNSFVYLDREALSLIPRKSWDTLMNKLKKTSGLFTRDEMRIKNPDKLAGIFIQRTKENLRFLWEKAEPWRDRAKQWYVGANRMATDWSKKYGLSINQVAGILAACSPKTDWFKNIEIAKRIIEGYQFHKKNNTTFTDELYDRYVQFSVESFEYAWKQNKKERVKKLGGETAFNEKQAAARELLANELAEDYQYVGKNWEELSSTDMGRAVLLRAHDVVNKAQKYYVYSPEGTPLYLMRNKSGELTKQGWTTYAVIRDSIKLMDNNSIESIHRIIGRKHKVRNFYNNILVPNSEYPFITIDTWAANASYLLPGAAESKMVKAGVAEGGSPANGIHGGYIMHAIAAIELAKELSAELGYKVHPREVQSVTWEAIRALFDESRKGGKIDRETFALKRQWQAGKITLREYFQQLEQLWGGFNTPEWAMGEAARIAAEQGVIPDVPQRAGPGDVPPALGGRERNPGGDTGPAAEGRTGTSQAGEEGRGPAEGPGGVGPSYSPSVIRRKIGKNNSDFAKPPSDEAAIDALQRTNSPKVSKFGLARKLVEGFRVGLRIDIPAYLAADTYVVTVHEKKKGQENGSVGPVIGYDTVARVKNPTFFVNEKRSGYIRDGVKPDGKKQHKEPIATVEGEYMTSREIPADINDWTPVGFNPKQHSFFYDKRTDKMVVGGEEAISVGNTVFVKNPVYGDRSKAAYSPSPVRRDLSWAKQFSEDAVKWTALPPSKGLKLGGYDTSFHINTVTRRLVDALIPGEHIDRAIESTRRRGALDRTEYWTKKKNTLEGALQYIRPLLADLTASLPAKRALDLKTGTTVDPYTPLRRAFPGGTRQDINVPLQELSKAVLAATSYGEDNKSEALRTVLNLAQLAKENGADVSSELLDQLSKAVHGKPAAALRQAEVSELKKRFNPEFYDVNQTPNATVVRKLTP